MTTLMIYGSYINRIPKEFWKASIGCLWRYAVCHLQVWLSGYTIHSTVQGMCIHAWPFISGCTFDQYLSMLSRNILHLQENPHIHKQGALFGGKRTLESFITVVADYFARVPSEKSPPPLALF